MFTQAEKAYLHSCATRAFTSLDNVDLTGISPRQLETIYERRARLLGSSWEATRRTLNANVAWPSMTAEQQAAKLSL
jgi:hypothetical protein